MESVSWYLIIALVLLGFAIGAAIGLVRGRGKQAPSPKPRPGIDYSPGVGDDDSVPRDTPRRDIADVGTTVLDEPPSASEAQTRAADQLAEDVLAEDLEAAVWEVEVPEPTKGRLHRLRERLAPTTPWARGSWDCCLAATSTMPPGMKSKRSCSPPT